MSGAPDELDPNPYRAPEAELGGPVVPLRRPVPTLLKNFRDQMLALGVMWLVLGVSQLALGFIVVAQHRALMDLLPFFVFVPVVTATGLLCVMLGVFILLKAMWAVYVGLAFGYLVLLSQLVTVNLCTSLLTTIGIIQMHRVIGWSRQLREAGIPLNARPKAFRTSNEP